MTSQSKARFKPYAVPSNKVELQGPKVFSGTVDLQVPCLNVHNVKSDQMAPYRLKGPEDDEDKKELLTVS